MSKTSETLTITYSPAGHEPISKTIPRPYKRFNKDAASKKDGRVIADAMLELVPGMRFNRSNFTVTHTAERTEVGSDGKEISTDHPESLSMWDEKAKRAYDKQVHI